MENKNCCGPDFGDLKTNTIKIDPQIKIANILSPLPQMERDKSCCGESEKCGSEPITKYDKNLHFIIGELKTNAGMVPQVSTNLIFSDTLGALKVRWGINRMDYKINPGIYAVGNPDENSHVLVTANYKLTFDTLRKELSDLNLWILVLDTKGINVWCAAGKGTFGTKELINRINKTKLNKIVAHKTLILPQLGAPGVSGHEITKSTGFKVIYGTIRAKDIKPFLNSGLKATDEMRTVKFNVINRLILTPIELVGTFKISLTIFGTLFLLNLFAAIPFGITDFYAYAGALVIGCVITPVLLPWIPGKAFSFKGWLIGVIWAITVNILNGWTASTSFSLIRGLGYLLVLPSISAFYSMNFTGSTTFTSFSGVLKEMKIAIPAIIITIGLGTVLILVNSFFRI